MLNRKQTDRRLIKIALGCYALFFAYNIADRYIFPHPGYHWEKPVATYRYTTTVVKLVKDRPDKGTKVSCSISTLCAGHSKEGHLKWDKEYKRVRDSIEVLISRMTEAEREDYYTHFYSEWDD